MYTNIQQAISAVESAYPSLFTKEDVIKLLKDIDLGEELPSAPGKIDVDELTDVVESIIGNFDTSDLVVYDDIELSINYDHRIEIENVNVDLDDLQMDVTNAIQEYFKKNS